MFKTERHDAILREVALTGRVTTTALAERFGVSEDSIRKDLQQLGAEGKLQRVYGGAVSIEDEPHKHIVMSRVDDFREQKLEIAKKALNLIEDGQTVFLDISSTNIYLANLLASSNKQIIVVSNMLDAVKKVAAGGSIEAQCPGGKVNLELNGFVGAATVQSLSNMSFDLAFMGTLELNVTNNSVATFDLEDGTVKQTVLKNSDRAYLVADSHKLHTQGKYRYARLSDFTGVIMEDGNEGARQAIRKLGIEVY